MTGWLFHGPVLPVLLPAVTAVVLLLLGDQRDDAGAVRLRAARRIALISSALGLLLSLHLAMQAHSGALMVYRLGDWPAPYGISLVVDRLSALMLVLTAAVALPVLLYASDGWDARGRHFHTLFQFQLMGLNGAFVTGDLFNLFVFFEVLLVASFALMLHGGGALRLRVGLHYVVLNLAASALLLIGVALVYGLTGTLNLADLALRVPRVLGADAALLKAAAVLLLVVFGFKAALAPLSLWLPATYAAAGAPVAALFAIMTKVGVYAILRLHGVIFGNFTAAGPGDSAALVAQPLLLPLALATVGVAVLGVWTAPTLNRLIAWLTVASAGTILAAVGLYDTVAWSAALYYLASSTLTLAGLFLLAELIAEQRGEIGGRLQPAPPVAQATGLGLLLLLGAVSAAGLPPLPGFIAKLMLLQASADHAAAPALWTAVLVAGFVALVALARAGTVLFWGGQGDVVRPLVLASPRRMVAAAALLCASVAMSALAAPLLRYTAAAAHQLTDRAAYARAVLPQLGGPAADSAAPYTGHVPGAASSPALGSAR